MLRFISIVFGLLLITAFLIVLYVFIDQLLNEQESVSAEKSNNNSETFEGKNEQKDVEKYDFLSSDEKGASPRPIKKNSVIDEYMNRIANRRVVIGTDIITADGSSEIEEKIKTLISLETVSEAYSKDLYVELSYLGFQNLSLTLKSDQRLAVSSFSSEAQIEKVKSVLNDRFGLTLVEAIN